MPMGAMTFEVKGGVEMTVPAEIINEGYNDEMYQAIFAEGLRSFAGKGMATIKATDKEAIKAKATENLQALAEGRIPGRAAKKAKVGTGLSKAVASMAMKLAREEVNILLTRAGRRPANVDARDKTRLAKEYLELPEYGPAVIEKARAMVAEFEAKADQVANVLNLNNVQESPVKVKMNQDRALRAKANKAQKAAAPPARPRRPTAEVRPSA